MSISDKNKDINKNIKDSTQSQKDFNKEAKKGEGIFEGYRDTLQSINVELGKKISKVKDASKEYSKLESIAQKLQYDEENISKLSNSQLDKLKKKAEIGVEELKRAAQSLDLSKVEKRLGQDLSKLSGEELKNTLRKARQQGIISNGEESLIRAKREEFQIEEEFLRALKKRVEQEKVINKSLGVAGNLLKGSSDALDKLGLGAFKNIINFDKINDKLRETTEELTEGGQKVLGFGGKLRVAGKAAGGLGKELFSAFLDPSILIGKIVEGLFAVNKAQTEFGKETGRNINGLDTLNSRIGIDQVDYIKAATEMTKELGFAADTIFEPDDIAEVAELTNHMGLAAKEAANIAKFSKLSGQSVEQSASSTISIANDYIKTNKAAINQKKVLQDVGNVSDSLAASLGGNPERIAKAAVAANALGLNLSEIDGIAQNLLNIENSLEKEMEAEVLLGKELNLEKARTAALNNDQATLSEEIKNQVGGLHEFSQMNRLEQEALADALGMNRDQLAKTVMQQEINNGMTEEQAALLAGVNLEDFKRQEAQEAITTAISKMAQAFAPIIQFVGWLLSKWYILYPLIGLVALSYMPKIVQGFQNLISPIKEGLNGLKGMVSGLKGYFGQIGKGGKLMDKVFGKFYKGGQFTPGGGRAPKGGKKAGGLIQKMFPKNASKALGETAKNTKGMDVKKGVGIAGFLKGLGEGLAAIGSKFGKVVLGGIALGIVGIALGGAFAGSMLMLQGVDPVQMIAFAGSLAILGLTVAQLGKVGGNIITGALVIGILALALIPAAYAFSMLAGVDSESIMAFSIALPLLALAAAGLGFLSVFIALGAVALAVLGGGLYAFGMGAAAAVSMTPNLENFVSQLKLFADPTLINSLYAIGPALILAGMGILAFQTMLAVGSVGSAVGGLFASLLGGSSDPLAPIKTLAALAPGLEIAAQALGGISSSIRSISNAIATLDLNKLKALEGLEFKELMLGALMTAPLLTLGEKTEGKGGDDGTSKKLDEIRGVLEAILDKEGVVMLDSNKVGTTMNLGKYKLQ